MEGDLVTLLPVCHELDKMIFFNLDMMTFCYLLTPVQPDVDTCRMKEGKIRNGRHL